MRHRPRIPTALLFGLAVLGSSRPSVPEAPLRRALPLDQVRVDDAFWTPRREANRRVTVPALFDQNEVTGRVANFERAAGRRPGAWEGRRFNDTDVYKAIEAAAWVLAERRDPGLEARIDHLVELIAAVQEPDGYLFPARSLDPEHPPAGVGRERWIHLNGSHELYSAGHLYEAAVTLYRATGDRRLLDVALRNAELIRATFGPEGRRAVPGHQEIELALVRLAAATERPEWLELARFFLDERGRPHDIEPYPEGTPFAMYNERAYRQDHEPVTRQSRAVGHAVRAVYMYRAMAELAASIRPPGYREALARLWRDVVTKRLYATGGVGARDTVEAFGDDYELPNETAYAETCAAVGNGLWNHRQFLLEGDAGPLDVMERILYNGALSGVSLSGDRFFYQNPLASPGGVGRTPYFEVACCPANISRLIGQLPELIYAEGEAGLWVNLFVGSEARLRVGDVPLRLAQSTRYPWDGHVRLELGPERPVSFELRLRVPGWAREQPVPGDLYRFATADAEAPVLRLNGAELPLRMHAGFARLERRFEPGDVVELELPMPVRRLRAHPALAADRDRIALQRGPLVYAVEGVDNGDRLASLALPGDAPLRHEFRADLLGGVEVITAMASREAHPVRILAVPYYAWANRGAGEMAVWLAER